MVKKLPIYSSIDYSSLSPSQALPLGPPLSDHWNKSSSCGAGVDFIKTIDGLDKAMIKIARRLHQRQDRYSFRSEGVPNGCWNWNSDSLAKNSMTSIKSFH